MARQLLIETKMNALSLQEGIKPKNPHCLGTMRGPCADYINETRNGNFYSKKLWENVFNDDLVKESLQDNVLIGELDHPSDRLETAAKNACIVMTGYEFNDADGVVEGTFDILDTPNGKILKSLLDYGCHVGVSSRGEGDVVEQDGKNVIDEDTYYFVAFDAVVLPAVKAAKPTLSESVHKRQSLRDSLNEQIKSATTVSELTTIQKLVEALELPESDSIMESINIKSKELEGTTSSSNLIEDLENTVRQLDEVKQENIKLKESVNTFKGRLGKAITTCNKMSSQIDSYKEENKKLNESLKKESSRAKEFELRLAKANRRFISQKESEDQIKEKYTAQIGKLNESLKRARQDLNDKDSEISDLNADRKDLIDRNRYDCEKQINEAIDKTKAECSKDKDAAVKAVKEQLNESKRSLAEKDDKYNALLKEYVKLKSQITGVDSSLILESVNKDSTSKSIDTLIESIVDKSDRYRSVSSIPDPLFSNSGTKNISIMEKENSETAQFKSFLEQAAKMI